jgi:glycosyltransferase involved in cell wall biosynthesis
MQPMRSATANTPASQPPGVTAIIPSRGRQDFLERAVRSVASQRYAGEVECLVVFDGGECALPSIELPARRTLRGIGNDRRQGAAPARNAGALAASFRVLAFLDDDDEWLPDKLDKQVRMLTAAPAGSVVCSGIEVVHGDRVVSRVLDKQEVTFRDLLLSRIPELHTSTFVVKRSDFFGGIGPFDEDTPGSFAEDYDWLLRAARKKPVLTVAGEPLARIHWHGSSFFVGRWKTMIAGLQYLIGKHPDFRLEPRGLARIYGQVAFAYAAAGSGPLSRSWARQTLRHDWRQPRAYLALLVGAGLLSPETLVGTLNRFGRGI